MFFRVCLTSPSLFFKNVLDSLKNLFPRWALQYLAHEQQFSSLLKQEQTMKFWVWKRKKISLVALTVLLKKNIFSQTLGTMQTHFAHWKVMLCFAFHTFCARWESVTGSRPLFSEGCPTELVRLAWFRVRNPGRKVAGRFADGFSRWTRDSVWNPLRERSCVSRLLSCYIPGHKGKGSGKNRREGVISPDGQEGPRFWEGLWAGSESRWITGCGWDWAWSVGRSEGRGTVLKGMQGTWVLGGWGPEVYQICRPRGSLRAGISSNSPSTYYRILFLFSLLFFGCWSL